MFNTIRKTLLIAALAIPALPAATLAQGCFEMITDTRGVYRDGGSATRVDIVASYYTQTTERDTFNSKGVKLSGYRAVLQQDRANVNRFGIIDHVMLDDVDSNGKMTEYPMYDDEDSFFTTPERRALFTSMPLVFECDGQGRPIDTENSSNFRFWTKAISVGRVSGTTHVVVFTLPSGGYGFNVSFAG